MKECTLVDTNVLISANGRETHADLQCQLACIEALEKICSEKKVLLDSIGLIMDEYAGYCSYKGEPGVGDYFFKYVHDHQMVEKKCLIVQITQDKKKGFVEFPDHPDLVSFDPSDRKFVAVAIASGVNPAFAMPRTVTGKNIKRRCVMFKSLLSNYVLNMPQDK